MSKKYKKTKKNLGLGEQSLGKLFDGTDVPEPSQAGAKRKDDSASSEKPEASVRREQEIESISDHINRSLSAVLHIEEAQVIAEVVTEVYEDIYGSGTSEGDEDE